VRRRVLSEILRVGGRKKEKGKGGHEGQEKKNKPSAAERNCKRLPAEEGEREKKRVPDIQKKFREKKKGGKKNKLGRGEERTPSPAVPKSVRNQGEKGGGQGRCIFVFWKKT